jgi:hypothetical protein
MRVVIFVAAMAGVAHAQAPGQTVPAAPVEQPAFPRWGIGAAFALESVKPSTPGATGVGLGVLELGGRYRLSLPVEFDLALDLGGSKTVSFGAIYIDARYRFRPLADWDWYLVGGIGAASIADKNAPDVDKSLRGSIRGGVGGERRFGQLALNAELKLVAVTSNTDAQDLHGTGESYWLARYGVGGLSLCGGATYAF